MVENPKVPNFIECGAYIKQISRKQTIFKIFTSSGDPKTNENYHLHLVLLPQLPEKEKKTYDLSLRKYEFEMITKQKELKDIIHLKQMNPELPKWVEELKKYL